MAEASPATATTAPMTRSARTIAEAVLLRALCLVSVFMVSPDGMLCFDGRPRAARVRAMAQLRHESEADAALGPPLRLAFDADPRVEVHRGRGRCDEREEGGRERGHEDGVAREGDPAGKGVGSDVVHGVVSGAPQRAQAGRRPRPSYGVSTAL